MSSGPQIVTAADFGFELRSEREARGITQAKLAEMANVSVRWLSNFERGQSPRAELIKVMHVFRALDLAFEVVEKRKPNLNTTQSKILSAFSTMTREIDTSIAAISAQDIRDSLPEIVHGSTAFRDAIARNSFGSDLVKQATAANDIATKAVRDALAGGTFGVDLFKQVTAANDISSKIIKDAVGSNAFGADLVKAALASTDHGAAAVQQALNASNPGMAEIKKMFATQNHGMTAITNAMSSNAMGAIAAKKRRGDTSSAKEEASDGDS